MKNSSLDRTPRVSDLAGLEWAWALGISNTFFGEANAVCLENILWNLLVMESQKHRKLPSRMFNTCRHSAGYMDHERKQKAERCLKGRLGNE